MDVDVVATPLKDGTKTDKPLHRWNGNTIEGHWVAVCGAMSRLPNPKNYGYTPPPGFTVCPDCECR